MCKRPFFLVCLALLLAMAGATTAQDWDVEIPLAVIPPLIDGQVDAIWSIASVQSAEVAVNGSPSGPEDCSARWQVMWDAENLYVLVDVGDQSLHNDSTSAYLDDSVEFYFDGGNSKGPGGPLSEDDRQYTFGWDADDIQGTNMETDGVEFAQVNTETGWRIEIKFPWTTLTEITPELDGLIGIDCFYNDDDDGGETREKQVVTFANDNTDWEHPSDWGTGILVRGTSEKAAFVSPEDGDPDVIREVVLQWKAGQFAVTHDVYFGTIFGDVNEATREDPRGVLVSLDQADSTYDPPGRLDFGQTYYWRIDEVNGAPDYDVFKGDVWSFAVEPFTYSVQGILVTTNVAVEAGQVPENLVNGSGLNENGQHSTTTTDMWSGTMPADEPAQVQFEFPRVHKLDQMRVWNHNFDFEWLMGIGVKNATVAYSSDGTDWTTLGDVEFTQAPGLSSYTYNSTVPFDGVAVKYVRLTIHDAYGTAPNMQTVGLSEVQFMYLPVYAREPEPADGAADVVLDATLRWRPGREAASHEVYMGADPDSLVLADTTVQSSYSPAILDLDTTYYWQVNEVNQAESIPSWASTLWSFSTETLIEIEDFESYNDDTEAETTIWHTWVDGLDDETNGGAMVGNDPSPFAELTIVHSGNQSMPLFYENDSPAEISETDRTFASAQNWTASRIKSLSLWFYGVAGNGGQLYVKINDTKVLYDGDPADIARAQWRPWNIDLSTVGGDLSNVASLSIGIEGTGSGVLYVDDIRLYPYDVETIVPVEPGTESLVAHYTFDEGAGTAVSDSSGQGNHGTVVGDPTWVAGAISGAMEFSGDDYVDCGNGASLQIQDAITVACWVKIASFTVDWETIIGMGDDSYRMSRGPITGDSVHWGCNGVTGGDLNGASPVTTDTWRHVALTYDGAYRIIYIDGVEDARVASTGQIDVSAYNLYIGENAQQTGRQLGGAVDDVRIYSRPLSPAEVAGLVGRTALAHVPF